MTYWPHIKQNKLLDGLSVGPKLQLSPWDDIFFALASGNQDLQE